MLEGEELALICQDINNRQNNKIAWRRKVSAVLPFIEINTTNIRLLFGISRQLGCHIVRLLYRGLHKGDKL